MPPREDPYATLGLTASASDADVRRAYRRLVKLHHPDHNAGSPEAAVRFAAVHSAYDEVLRRRSSQSHPAEAAEPDRATEPTGVDARLAAMEREMAATKPAPAAAQEPVWHPSREDLGYYDTDDTFTSIIDDAVSEASERWKESDAKRKFTKRLTDLFGD